MRISNLLENSSRIVFPLKGLNSEEVIEELLAALHIKDKQKKEYLKAFKEREKDYSTGIGNEIAIPHIRSKKEETFRFAIGISPEGIPFFGASSNADSEARGNGSRQPDAAFVQP